MVYRIGDMVTHPLHGAGVIAGIETQRVDGKNREYYILKLPSGDMKVKIPLDASDKVGVRPIIDADEAERILCAISEIKVSMTSNWNKRYRENMDRIKTGNLIEVASVVKGLVMRDKDRGLSTGERKMLHSAKQILISEIVLSTHSSYEDVEARIERAMA